MTGIVFLIIGLTGVIISLFFSKLPSLSPILLLLLWASFVCRIFLRQNRLLGILLILTALTIPLNTNQAPFLFLAIGTFLNGLVIMVNKGMPIQGYKFSNGMHIPMDSAKLTFLGDLSVLGRWSVGDVFIISFFWLHLLLFWMS